MAIIPQKQLFSWEQVQELGDLERLGLVLRSLPDEALMRELEKERGWGRDDYPVRVVWNSILAGVVFQHSSVESLRRELQRNAQLRALCGFDLAEGASAVPSSAAYSRFLRKLLGKRRQIDAMFDELVESLREVLPGFGGTLAIDGKAINSYARSPKKGQEPKEPDGRRDVDANWGKKTMRRRKEDGTVYEEVKSWFGYKLHLVVEADYELPVAYQVTRASRGEPPQARALIHKLQKRHPKVLVACDIAVADKGDDDTALIRLLWEEHQIKPVIPIRDQWNDGEPTRRVSNTRNVVYDHEGNVSCCCMKTGELRRMAYAGFEKDREALKYRCPAKHYGMSCPAVGDCPVKGSVRIKLSEDRRVFTPVARSSYAWQRAYKKRSAVERVNSRLDGPFGFEEHFIRRLAKMRLRVGLAMVVMLAMALGRIKEKQKDKLRSLVKAA
jgi:hypothetical protein